MSLLVRKSLGRPGHPGCHIPETHGRLMLTLEGGGAEEFRLRRCLTGQIEGRCHPQAQRDDVVARLCSAEPDANAFPDEDVPPDVPGALTECCSPRCAGCTHSIFSQLYYIVVYNYIPPIHDSPG